jgi:hypothetical protein
MPNFLKMVERPEADIAEHEELCLTKSWKSKAVPEVHLQSELYSILILSELFIWMEKLLLNLELFFCCSGGSVTVICRTV